MQPNPTHTKLTLKVINLWGEPGAGKSTVAAGLFNLMKLMGEKVELVTEYAKDLTYEKNHGSLQNQLLILATQDNRLRRLEGQVEWAITDSPLPLGILYVTPEYDEWLEDAAFAAFERYDNRSYVMLRPPGRPYKTWGRSQSEPAAAALQVEMREIMLDATRDQDDVLHVISDSEAPYVIYRSLRLPGNESTLAFDNGRFDL